MELYLLGGNHPKSLGYLSIEPDVASTFLKAFDADDGILWPLRARDAEQEESSRTAESSSGRTSPP